MIAEIIDFHVDENEKDILRLVRSVLRGNLETPVGCVFVMWNGDGSSVCNTFVKDGSRIPPVLVPDFVRNLLMEARFEKWAAESACES